MKKNEYQKKLEASLAAAYDNCSGLKKVSFETFKMFTDTKSELGENHPDTVRAAHIAHIAYCDYFYALEAKQELKDEYEAYLEGVPM